MPQCCWGLWSEALCFLVVSPIFMKMITHEQLKGIILTFGIDVHLDSRMSWLEFGGQRSKIIVTLQTFFLVTTEEFIFSFMFLLWKDFTQMLNRINRWSDDIFRIFHYFKGQLPCDIVMLQKHNYNCKTQNLGTETNYVGYWIGDAKRCFLFGVDDEYLWLLCRNNLFECNGYNYIYQNQL